MNRAEAVDELISIVRELVNKYGEAYQREAREFRDSKGITDVYGNMPMEVVEAWLQWVKDFEKPERLAMMAIRQL